MINVAIIGASGYTGAELLRLLADHPQVQITAATSRQHDGKHIAEVYPHLAKKIDIICRDASPEELCKKADLFFTAVPHKTAMEIVPQLLVRGKKVIDLSADFRLKDRAVYEEWYQAHSAPKYIEEAVYGLPELYRDAISRSSLIANPGCYPTSIILALAPLLENRAIITSTIIADSKSGTSGAGRSPSTATLYCEVADGFRPYKVTNHRHTPEIEQELSLLSNDLTRITFTPHLLPVSRGILSTIYAELQEGVNEQAIREMYAEKYSAEPFIRLKEYGQPPATQHVRGSNYCDIGFAIDHRTRRIIIMSAIDNIGKGASGQAVQNMNILWGFEENDGLKGLPLFP